MTNQYQNYRITGLLILAAVTGLAGIDLVLPALPFMPELFKTTSSVTQFIIATYVAGTTAGLLTFGALASKYPPFSLLFAGLLGFGLTSVAASYAQSIEVLLLIRFTQGFTSIGPAVLAPGIIRSIYTDKQALRVIGLMGSVESVSPALAPIAGAALLSFGWQASFWVTGGIAFLLALAIIPVAMKRHETHQKNKRPAEKIGYFDLIKHRPYLRMAGVQSMLLGGLLVFVFAAPTVIVTSMNGALSDFIMMQVSGVTCFVIAANSAGPLTERFGRETMLKTGTGLGFIAASGLVLYALTDKNNPALLIPLFLPLNISMGLTGPVAFLSAIEAGLNDDAKASALLFLMITCTSAGLTALVAPFIEFGLIAPAFATLLAVSLSVLSLYWLKDP